MAAVDAFEYNMNSFMSHKFILFTLLIGTLCGLFLGITLLQSGLNKLFDYKGNKSYFDSVFEKTFMRHMTGMLLPIILVMELSSAVMMLVGIVLSWCCINPMILGYGLSLAALNLICLLTGQRIAKDYAGAASLTGYFMIAMIGLFAVAMMF